jgi:hypothetical protein
VKLFEVFISLDLVTLIIHDKINLMPAKTELTRKLSQIEQHVALSIGTAFRNAKPGRGASTHIVAGWCVTIAQIANQRRFDVLENALRQRPYYT